MKEVFDSAQRELARVFGMKMTELPQKEKVTLKDRMGECRLKLYIRRGLIVAAVRKNSTVSASSKVYVLSSILPAAYRGEGIVAVSKCPTTNAEASYVGFYAIIVCLIQLNGGKLADSKLERYLKRMNADVNTPMDRTEMVLQKMIKQGYVVKIKDTVGEDEIMEWIVGPRGKIEFDTSAVAALVEKVYGENAPDDLPDRLRNSLGQGPKKEKSVARPAAGCSAE
jgi:hypothetical protein